MSKLVVIGGIQSTCINAQLLYDLGEKVVLFCARSINPPGWEDVDLVDESDFGFSQSVPELLVNGNINEHIEDMQAVKSDYIWSLGWQQIYRPEMFELCTIIGIHESLFPRGAGAVPIANAILRDRPRTGVTLFELDGGMDTGPIIGQLVGNLDPRRSTSTQLYQEALELEQRLILTFLPLLREGIASRIPQSREHRAVYGKVQWENWPAEKVKRARIYPHV